MRRKFKDFFIPHEHNDYHPHILHTKRAVLYSAVFLFTKGIVFVFALLVPAAVFVSPDILLEQQLKIVDLTQQLRADLRISGLVEAPALGTSSQLKAENMAWYSYFSHTGPNGEDLSYFLDQAGYKYKTAGENLAMGFDSAEELFNAWVGSGSHYKNLVDADFDEIGVRLEGGMYNRQPVIYVAQHFGKPLDVPPATIVESPTTVASFSESAGTKQHSEALRTSDVSTEEIIQDRIQEDSEIDQVQELELVPEEHTQPESQILPVQTIGRRVNRSFEFDKSVSSVDWESVDKGVQIFPRARIVGDVLEATVFVGTYAVPLSATNIDDAYVGTIVIEESADTLFRFVVHPSIRIVGINGQVVEEQILWERIHVAVPTPVDKYTRARNVLSSITPLFELSRNIYLGAIIFFTLALLLKIVIEIRHQHYHIIAQTLGVIVLLFSLWLV